MASRDPILLHPVLREKCLAFLEACKDAGLDVILTCTGRTADEQSALYAQGRQPLSYVNNLRADCGLYPLTAQENKRKVTWTLISKHLIDSHTGWCSAFDFALLLPNKKAHWDLKANVDNDSRPDYEEAGLIALEQGLDWGGRWQRNPDFPHCQLLMEV